ncbi:MAG: histidinol dehydrogenase, partial [Deltaproteobacteria bacterium]|nr:histidinol dehydrogenase [Deltaproteobacteria bacterium]
DGTNLEFSHNERAEAAKGADTRTIEALEHAAGRIRRFHEKQRESTWSERDDDGVELGQIIRPLKRVGIYVPGGKASYPSSVLMNAVTAKVAGVSEIIMVTPTPNGEINPYVLAAARIAGVDRIFRIGGAQAVAALAYGTERIPQVDKIVGPGNIYVALAKKLVFGLVDIDMIAGPSEILVLADETADPGFIAADLLSQAEHDELAWPILVATSRSLIDAVEKAIEKQLEELPRREIARKSLDRFGSLIFVPNLEKGAEVANAIGPEHLEVMTAVPKEILGSLENAGAIFCGPFTPEPVGDYMAGPNHVLPTGGTSRFFSPLHVGDFYKRSSLLSFTEAGFRKIADDTIRLAELEGLPGHARSVRIRKDAMKGETADESSP